MPHHAKGEVLVMSKSPKGVGRRACAIRPPRKQSLQPRGFWKDNPQGTK
ncbi:MAG: hypothetical protein LBU67_04730 [Oscillospiraceae bacterium]|nr:hypothetical protein [Oscillospiraceae bacterium]